MTPPPRLAEPGDGTVLVMCSAAGACRAIVRDDRSGMSRGRHWFDAADPDEPMTWRQVQEYADQLYPLGSPLLAAPGQAGGG